MKDSRRREEKKQQNSATQEGSMLGSFFGQISARLYAKLLKNSPKVEDPKKYGEDFGP